jgi:hypothetical protein
MGFALPAGPVGVAIKAAIGLIIAAVWTSTPGAEEARSVHPRRMGLLAPGAAPLRRSAAVR